MRITKKREGEVSITFLLQEAMQGPVEYSGRQYLDFGPVDDKSDHNNAKTELENLGFTINRTTNSPVRIVDNHIYVETDIFLAKCKRRGFNTDGLAGLIGVQPSRGSR